MPMVMSAAMTRAWAAGRAAQAAGVRGMSSAMPTNIATTISR
jgi:hypothetical protein